jgi:hypothetical protein
MEADFLPVDRLVIPDELSENQQTLIIPPLTRFAASAAHFLHISCVFNPFLRGQSLQTAAKHQNDAGVCLDLSQGTGMN